LVLTGLFISLVSYYKKKEEEEEKACQITEEEFVEMIIKTQATTKEGFCNNDKFGENLLEILNHKLKEKYKKLKEIKK
jgi:non-homologous end joining protein Ku